MPAPKRNRFAAKAEEEQHSEALYVRLRKHDKQRIVQAAGNVAVAEWVRGVLLSAVAAHRTSSANNRVDPTADPLVGLAPGEDGSGSAVGHS